MKSILALFAMLSASCLAGDITGNWKGTTEGPNGSLERTFAFKVDGAKLTGETASSFAGKSTITNGKVEGDKVSFTINIKIQDNEMTINYKGVVNGDSIKFTAESPASGGTMEWDTKRVK